MACAHDAECGSVSRTVRAQPLVIWRAIGARRGARKKESRTPFSGSSRREPLTCLGESQTSGSSAGVENIRQRSVRETVADPT